MGWRSKKENGGGIDAIENVIGRSAVVRGDMKADGAFRVDGTVEGSVESKAGVVIGEGGAVLGDVKGTEVVVAGRVQGNVFATGHLDILAKGLVEGDIEGAQSVRIERGGVFRGTSRMGTEEREPGTASKAGGKLTSI